MPKSRNMKREIEALRARSAALNAAVLRINASLDLDTVLDEIMDSARALTGARRGALVSVDGAGVPREFLLRGFTPEEEQELAAWPDSLRLFEHLRGLPGPLRLPDFPEYVRTLGKRVIEGVR